MALVAVVLAATGCAGKKDDSPPPQQQIEVTVKAACADGTSTQLLIETVVGDIVTHDAEPGDGTVTVFGWPEDAFTVRITCPSGAEYGPFEQSVGKTPYTAVCTEDGCKPE